MAVTGASSRQGAFQSPPYAKTTKMECVDEQAAASCTAALPSPVTAALSLDGTDRAAPQWAG
jgi:hypothetical protein